MPYQSLGDLPESVRNTLPHHAQEIYKEAFNSAYEQYDHEEERSHKVAWSAVKKEYLKDPESGEWVRDDD